MKSPPTLGCLPQELRDLIVDQISLIPNETERIQTLCATALVSRRFRYWAHKRLFATVLLRGKVGKSPSILVLRLRRLQELIYADPHSATTGLASHIRSFTLSMAGMRSLVVPPLEGEELGLVLRKIHRVGARPRSLSILLFMPGDNDQLEWMSLNRELRRALISACRSPLLTTLRLRGFKNLPHDILVGCSVENIKFNNISLKDPSQSDDDESPGSAEDDMRHEDPGNVITSSTHIPVIVETSQSLVTDSPICSRISRDSTDPKTYGDAVRLSEPPASECASVEPKSALDYVQLDSIETDNSFPILEILDLTPTRSHPPAFLFQKLKNLTMNIKTPAGFRKTAELFPVAPFIEKLELKLNCSGATRNVLSLHSLSQLKHLRLIHRLHTPSYAILSSATLPHPTVQDMINLLSYSELPKSLRRISITLSLKPPYISYAAPSPPSEAGEDVASNAATTGHNGDDDSGGATINVDPSSSATLPSTTNPASADDTTTSGEPASASTSTKAAPPSTSMVPIARLFAHSSNIFKPLDDLLGSSITSGTVPSVSSDRFADITYITLRLEVDLYIVPKEFTKEKEKEFIEEAGEYVRNTFFSRLTERIDKLEEENLAAESGERDGECGVVEKEVVDDSKGDSTKSSRRGCSGFGVVVMPRYRTMI